MSPAPDEIASAPDYLSWVRTLQELEDARVHIGELIDQMGRDKRIGEIDFGIQFGHIYGHLNRVWNGRRLSGGDTETWCSDKNSQLPSDITIT